MSVRRHLHFGETPRFDTLFYTVQRNTDNKGRLAYANYNPSLGEPPTEAQKLLLASYKTVLPILTFVGSEKLHGENMAVCYSKEELWVQGRNHIRTILEDQNGMAMFVESTKEHWLTLINGLSLKYNIDTSTHTLVVDCEWAGGNIQKGNAACSGTEKGAYIFDYFRAVDNITNEEVLYETNGVSVVEEHIYNMQTFKKYVISIDFNKPEDAAERIDELALSVEAASPIAKYFDLPANVGEGVYLYSIPTAEHKMYRLKAKGDKHGGKPKEPKTDVRSTAEIELLKNVAGLVTPVWRITQAMTETNATERSHIGEVIKWVIADVVKEDIQIIIDAEVELKDLSRFISEEVKTYYFNSLKP